MHVFRILKSDKRKRVYFLHNTQVFDYITALLIVSCTIVHAVTILPYFLSTWLDPGTLVPIVTSAAAVTAVRSILPHLCGAVNHANGTHPGRVILGVWNEGQMRTGCQLN